MIPVETFILRQKTRPSEDEGKDLFLKCLAKNQDRLISFLTAAEKQPNMGLKLANLRRDTDDIDQQLSVFIKAEGGQRYLEDRTHFCVEIFQFSSGNPLQETRVAIVYAREPQDDTSQHMPEVAEFLARGKRWEELEHWGDALACYNIGLVLHPTQPDLLFRLGRIQMRFPRYLLQGLENLKKVAEMRPSDWVGLAELGRCYRLLANTPQIDVVGRPREDLRHIALGLLERAWVIKSDDPSVQADLQALRQELGIRSEEGLLR